jgi:hypothetical protein
MAEFIDYLIQDSDVLLKAIGQNREAMTAKGFTDERYTELANATGDLIEKEAAQARAVKLVNEKTAEQNDVMKKVIDTMQQIKDAAKSAFGNDPAKLNVFKVGGKITKSVKSTRSLAEYFKNLTVEYKDVLLANGLVQEDLDGLNSLYQQLISTDADQENAKKLKKTSTLVRNESAKALKELLFKARNFAKSCFAKNPEILLQFKPLPKGRSGGNGTEEAVVKEKAAN